MPNKAIHHVNRQKLEPLFILAATLVLLSGIVGGYQLGEWIKAL